MGKVAYKNEFGKLDLTPANINRDEDDYKYGRPNYVGGIPMTNKKMNQHQVVKKINELGKLKGIKITTQTLKRHAEKSWIDEPELSFLGKGKGRELLYEPDAFAEEYANLFLVKNKEFNAKQKDIPHIRKLALELDNSDHDYGAELINNNHQGSKIEWLSFWWLKIRDCAKKGINPDTSQVIYTGIETNDGKIIFENREVKQYDDPKIIREIEEYEEIMRKKVQERANTEKEIKELRKEMQKKRAAKQSISFIIKPPKL